MMRRKEILQRLLVVAFMAICLVEMIGWSGQAKTTLTWTTWLGGDGFATLKRRADLFEKKNPDIQIKLVSVPCTSYQDYKAKLLLMHAGGNAPDIMHLVVNDAEEWLNAGVLYNITDLVAQSGFDYGQYLRFPSAYRRDGRIWGGMETHVQLNMMFYNPTLFDERGLETPTQLHRQGRWNIDTFLSAAKKLTVDSNGDGQFDIYGVYNPPDRYMSWDYWMIASGGEYVDIKARRVTLDSPETLKALEFWNDLVFKYRVAPVWGDPVFTDHAIFAKGKIGMTITGTNLMHLYNTTVPDFKYAAAVPPMWKRRAFRVAPGADALICSQTKHPKEAWRFLQFLLGPEVQNDKGRSKMEVPVLKSALKSWMSPPPDQLDCISDMVDYLVPEPAFAGFWDVENIIYEEMTAVAMGRKSLPEAVKSATVRGNAALQKAVKK